MNKYSFWQRMRRLVQYRLVVPLKRSKHPPEHAARGTAVGLAWAMTPLVGIQMWLVLMTWVFCKKALKWDFSLPLGLAWTWVTNVVTLPPVYYAFYVVGQIMRGKENISGYDHLSETIHNTFLGDLTIGEKWGMIFDLLVKDWGVSMCVGCIPFAIIFGFGGYYVTLFFVKRHRAAREERMRKNAKKRTIKRR